MRVMAQLLVALAGVTLATASFAADGASPADAMKHVGEHARVCGKVVSAKYAQSSRRSPTFLNLDEPYPNQVFTAVIWGDAKPRFKTAPELLKGHAVCVTGTITLYKGRAEMEVSDPAQIKEVQGTPK
ncbi:MAG TPA: DNA-binding protein [Myxococcota bacterium]|nr:DNA-binding protein [Myxococcota bacterium]